MLDFAMWLGTTMLLALLQIVEWLQTPPGLIVLGVLAVACAGAALYGYQRRRPAAPADEEPA